jgi:hypothetical protein
MNKAIKCQQELFTKILEQKAACTVEVDEGYKCYYLNKLFGATRYQTNLKFVE